MITYKAPWVRRYDDTCAAIIGLYAAIGLAAFVVSRYLINRARLRLEADRDAVIAAEERENVARLEREAMQAELLRLAEVTAQRGAARQPLAPIPGPGSGPSA